MKPRTLWACQPVAFISSLAVAPPGRFSRSRIWAVLLPSRAPDSFLAGLAPFAPLGAFFAGLVFLADLALAGATWRAGFATLAFLVAFGGAAAAVAWAVPVSSAIDVVILRFLLCAVITASRHPSLRSA